MKVVVLPGLTMSKKNSKEMGRTFGGRPILRASKQYKAWESEVLWSLKGHVLVGHSWEYPLVMKFNFYRKGRHRYDFNNMTQGPTDVLAQAGIIRDDSVTHIKTLPNLSPTILVDKNNPRCEIFIWGYSEFLELLQGDNPYIPANILQIFPELRSAAT